MKSFSCNLKRLKNINFFLIEIKVLKERTNQIVLQKKRDRTTHQSDYIAKKRLGGKSCLSPHVQDTRSFARLDNLFSYKMIL